MELEIQPDKIPIYVKQKMDMFYNIKYTREIQYNKIIITK